jgi:hypothetical protein
MHGSAALSSVPPVQTAIVRLCDQKCCDKSWKALGNGRHNRKRKTRGKTYKEGSQIKDKSYQVRRKESTVKTRQPRSKEK